MLGLTLLPSLSRSLTQLVATRPDPEAVFRASARELHLRWGLPEGVARKAVAERAALDLDRELDKLRKCGAQTISILDEQYPKTLARIPRPPPLLYVKGNVMPDGPCVAVVGSRKASAYGLAAAEQLAGELAAASVTVVSGFALGIDHAAHRAVLDAGGTTIAVLGCGIDICYPRRHAAFVPSILRSGCFISELPVGTPPLSYHFPMRNRIISGLSLATVVVEAAVNSGALYTADFALAQGREVLAVPGSIHAATSAGTNALLADGAAPARCAEDIFDAVGLETPERALTRRERLSEGEAALVGLLLGRPSGVDELAAMSSRPAEEVSAILTILEVRGIVRRGMDQQYVAVGV